ncbi:LPS-assembly lipoprotein [Rosenbergiella nectarea]|uniref:LPS-assembly lipoprotein LptE n=1 Tax=Rosenbergiella nectarea TaxID=988801 RepID=A0A1H9H176_9GAMM|nr:LPS assembly lipoprotein LptE [Rosenbergiella nectarea]SEQ56013.1 LPS-assembly lipoprotein [Rosenbergiella nectarea]
MRHFLLCLMMATAVLSTAGCGFHTRGNTKIPKEMKTMILTSDDPYGPLARAVRQQLRLSGIKLVEDSATQRVNVPTLRLAGENNHRDTASVFLDGSRAEYQLVMTITGQILIPGKGIFPLHTTVYRSYFDNSGNPLAADSEQDMISQEMRVRASEQLVRQLLAVHAAEQQINGTAPVAQPAALGQPEVITSTSEQSSNAGVALGN